MIDKAEVYDVLSWVQAVDGHPRGDVDTEVWFDAAIEGRWDGAELDAAVRVVGRSFTGYRLMPGHIDAEIRRARQARPPERPALPASTASEEAKAAAILLYAESVARRMGVPRAFEATPQPAIEPPPRHDPFAGVDECELCDRTGMRLDAPDVVCGNHSRNSTKVNAE